MYIKILKVYIFVLLLDSIGRNIDFGWKFGYIMNSKKNWIIKELYKYNTIYSSPNRKRSFYNVPSNIIIVIVITYKTIFFCMTLVHDNIYISYILYLYLYNVYIIIYFVVVRFAFWTCTCATKDDVYTIYNNNYKIYINIKCYCD